jgi:lipoyl(octanoyl) transferase
MLKVVELGVMPYEQALAKQHEYHLKVRQSSGETEYLIVVQHPPVLTFGKHATAKNLLLDAESLKQKNIEIIQTDRGGEVTAHEPGQLVIYPILHLTKHQLSVRTFVDKLEDSVIFALSQLGLQAARHSVNPGVWCENQKICAIGIRIKQRVSMHGIALNISNDLSTFDAIVPCGLLGFEVTSVERVLNKKIDFQQAQNCVIANIILQFN